MKFVYSISRSPIPKTTTTVIVSMTMVLETFRIESISMTHSCPQTAVIKPYFGGQEICNFTLSIIYLVDYE